MKKKTIEGVTIFGDKRIYTFELIDAESGLELFHEFASVIALYWSNFAPIVSRFVGVELAATKEEAPSFDELIKMLPSVFDLETLLRLSKILLKNASVTDENGNSTTTGESGIVELTQDDPLEQYTALFYSVVANYPKYASFFMEAEADSKTAAAAASQQ